MSVSLYDLLDVDESASAEEIRAAWKSAIAELDPTDRRFRAYNDAAAVLLDEDKRAAYDAELAAARGDDPADAPADDVDDAKVPADDVEVPADGVEVPADDVEVPADHPVEAGGEDEPAPAAPAAPEATAAESSGPPTWAVAVATVAAVLSLAFAIVVATWPGSLGGESPAEQEEAAAAIEQAGAEAESFAAEAIPVVLSYDYRTLDADFAEAEEFLTDDFAAQRTDLFEQQTGDGITLREQVVRDKVVVTAVASDTGLTRVSDDGGRATVVVFVNQDSQHGNAAPRSLRMWATLDVVEVDGEWLLDDICTESDCSD